MGLWTKLKNVFNGNKEIIENLEKEITLLNNKNRDQMHEIIDLESKIERLEKELTFYKSEQESTANRLDSLLKQLKSISTEDRFHSFTGKIGLVSERKDVELYSSGSAKSTGSTHGAMFGSNTTQDSPFYSLNRPFVYQVDCSSTNSNQYQTNQTTEENQND